MDKQTIIDYICDTPGNNNPAVLSSLLDEFGGSDKPTGTIEITENGSVDVTKYATADVNVSGGGGEPIETVIWELDVDVDTIDETYSWVEHPMIFDIGDYDINTDWAKIEYIITNQNSSSTDENKGIIITPLRYFDMEAYPIETPYLRGQVIQDYEDSSGIIHYAGPYARYLFLLDEAEEGSKMFMADENAYGVNTRRTSRTYSNRVAIPIKISLMKF